MKNIIVKSGTAQLAVNQQGAGQALVFLHAGVADKRSWQPLIGALSETIGSFHGVTFDRRGFGDSTFTEERHSRVGDLIAVLDACDLSPAVLIGNSQGGRIAIDTALLHGSECGRWCSLVQPSAARRKSIPTRRMYLNLSEKLKRRKQQVILIC